jgi:hypothetical protein
MIMFTNFTVWQLTQQDLEHAVNAGVLLFFGFVAAISVCILIDKFLDEE